MKKKTNSYYDRIASIYDRTRWLTNNIADEVADMIINLVNANLKTSFLELGVGTYWLKCFSPSEKRLFRYGKRKC